MTAFAASFGSGTDAGLSTDAWLLYEQRLHGFVASPSVGAQNQRFLLAAVQAAASEANQENWDGEGSAPVEQTTLRYTAQFVWALPQGTPVPSVVVDRDGDIVLDWGTHPRRTFSVSIGRDGTLTYAGLFDRAQVHGRDSLLQGIPPTILVNIERTGHNAAC